MIETLDTEAIEQQHQQLVKGAGIPNTTKNDDITVVDIFSLRREMPLEKLPPALKEAFHGYKEMMDLAPDETIISALFSITSFVAATQYEVLHPTMTSPKKIPLVTYIINIADSGAGKSTVYDKCIYPVNKGVEDAINELRKTFDTDPDAPDISKECLDPVLKDVTASGLVGHLNDHKVCMLSSPDAGGFIGGYSFKEEATRFSSFMCSAWSGEGYSNKNSDPKKRIHFDKACAGMLLMTQPYPAQAFYAVAGSEGIGLHARILPTISPPPKKLDLGTLEELKAQILNIDHEEYHVPDAVFDHGKKLRDRICDYIVEEYDLRLPPEKKLDLKAIPKGRVVSEGNKIMEIDREEDTVGVIAKWMFTWNEYTDPRSDYFGNKMRNRLVEHATRLAAMFAWSEDKDEIDAEMMEYGCVWAEHFFQQYQAVRSTALQTKDELAAQQLLVKLRKFADERSIGYFTLREFIEAQPKTFDRKLGNMAPILHWLEREDYLEIGREYSYIRGKTVITLN